MRLLLAAIGMILGLLVVGPLLIGGSGLFHAAEVPAPPAPLASTAPADAMAPDAGRQTTVMVGEPTVRFEEGSEKKVALYLPKSIKLRDGHFDLVVHFHGPHDRTRSALDEVELGAVMVSLNLGEGGPIYEGAATGADFLGRVIAFAEHGADESGRVPGGRVGRLALSSWSAGFGAVRELMRRPTDVARVDGVLLADGLFTDWNTARRRSHPHEANLEKVAGVLDFARQATKGEKLFVLTHSAIDRRSYADAPDIAEEMVRLFKLEKVLPDEPRRSPSQPPNYAADMGSLHIWSYGGKTWADHLAQHEAIRKHFAALQAFWCDC